MAEFLKRAPATAGAVSDAVRDTVSDMLREIERRGEGAVRSYSESLDSWAPASFVVGGEEIAAAEAQVGDELAAHIDFAQRQVRAFARAQRETLHDLETEPLPGVVIGHRHVPVRAVGSYVPGGPYPMLASAFMTVVVPKVAGVARVVACAPPRSGRGIHPAQLYAMAASGADQIVCLGGVQGSRRWRSAWQASSRRT